MACAHHAGPGHGRSAAQGACAGPFWPGASEWLTAGARRHVLTVRARGLEAAAANVYLTASARGRPRPPAITAANRRASALPHARPRMNCAVRRCRRRQDCCGRREQTRPRLPVPQALFIAKGGAAPAVRPPPQHTLPSLVDYKTHCTLLPALAFSGDPGGGWRLPGEHRAQGCQRTPGRGVACHPTVPKHPSQPQLKSTCFIFFLKIEKKKKRSGERNQLNGKKRQPRGSPGARMHGAGAVSTLGEWVGAAWPLGWVREALQVAEHHTARASAARAGPVV